MRLLPIFIALLLAACEPSEGDRCEPSDGRCLSASEALACGGGTLRRVSCRGEGGCEAGDPLRCDQRIGAEGDACLGGAACTEDRSAFLVCRDGRFALGARCPHQCQLEGDRASCDQPELAPALQ